ncbi:CBN-DOG-1 protein [Caenorhabditis brenneri]|uniref:CBN-DOG-1 protein n=1 Tax=Caenorhabditis brenneri TaxID=135651 RepID=G0NCH0_CAEBE|nr:CBN-DOG-1 protein [Caenorhabditis brenneri]
MSSMDAFWKRFENKKKEGGRATPSSRQPFRIVKKEANVSAEDSGGGSEVQAVDPDILKKVKKNKRKRIQIKNDDYEQLMMLSVPVRFPQGMSLYPTQKLMIVRILAALKNSQNVLGESPTGSGKTMALLSSTCAWLKQYIDEKRESKEKCAVHGNFMRHEDDEDSKDGIKKEEDLAKEDIKPVIGAAPKKKEDLFEEQWNDDFIPHSPPTAAIVKQEVNAEVKKEAKPEPVEQKTSECTCLPRVRIYYGTRTHKQIAQVVKEFSRLPYANIIKHTILASREQSCIHPTARKQPDISQYCKEINSANGIGCTFKTNMRPRFEKAAPMRDHLQNNGTVVFDIDEVVETLATSYPQLCPYFSTNRILTQDADLIFCPFSYLVDPLIRNSSDVTIKNSVVILDEAHNIEDTCRDAASFTFTEKEFDDSLLSFRLKRIAIDTILSKNTAEEELAQMEDFSITMKEFRTHLLYLEHLVLEMLRWVRQVAQHAKTPPKSRQEGFKSCTMSSDNLFASLTDPENGIDLFTPPQSPKHAAIAASFDTITRHNEPEMQAMDQFKPSSTAIVCIEKWLYFQTYFGNQQYQTTYRLNVSVEPVNYSGRFNNTFDGDSTMNTSYSATNRTRNSAGPRNMQYKEENAWVQEAENDGDEWIDTDSSPTGHKAIFEGCKTSVSLWCMSPALSFFDAFSETRSIILASGTLCPMDTLKTELGMEFKQQVEGDQVISPDNIFAAVLPIGPHGNRVQCTFRNTSDPDSPFYSEVGSIIKYVCSNVPAGILCFLPSYRVLEQLKTCMTRNLSMKKIETKKVVLFEPRRSSELSNVMDQFDAAIFNPKNFGPTINGALMFAVFRGKVSEGIDFADDRARVVISVGIPYPNAMDDQVNAKKSYNDMNSKEMGILTGDEWYTTQAYRALNQALGRCLRHKNDWGAMLMIDERLERQTGNLQSGAVSARVSKWIRAQLKSYPSFKTFNASFREFIERQHAVVKKEELEDEI